MDAEAAVHRALANPLRRRVLAVLRGEEVGRSARSLAAGFDVHVNTMRVHLGVLEGAGLVRAEPLPRTRPGRPLLAYRITSQGERAPTGDAGYRLLASMLAGHLQTTATEPSEVATRIGAAWGQHLVARPEPFEELDADEGIARLLTMLEELGFEPELDGGDEPYPRLLLHRCPFLDVAREHQDVVCSIHLGLMRGALDELGVPVAARSLHPFVTPYRCESRLEVPA